MSAEDDELREANRDAVHGGPCLFSYPEDEDYDCGGCACHLSAPCAHCEFHLPRDDSDYITTMLDLTGRWTR